MSLEYLVPASIIQTETGAEEVSDPHVSITVYNNQFGGIKPCMVGESGALIPSCFGKAN